MKNETIIKEAEKRGLKWEYKKYMYWECLFVEGTAVTFREHGNLQGQCVIQPPRREAARKGMENGMIYTAFVLSILYYVLG